MPARTRRSVSHTVLLVGEGTTEQAFLRYIKSLYISRGCGVGVTIRNARGKGPDHVVDYAIRQCRNAAYDRVVAVLDTDLEMSVAVRRRARTKRVQIIGSTPCIEGLLLAILGEHVPATTAECKQRYGGVLANDERYKDQPDKNDYSHVSDALQYCLMGGGAGDLISKQNYPDASVFKPDLSWVC